MTRGKMTRSKMARGKMTRGKRDARHYEVNPAANVVAPGLRTESR